MTAQCTYRAMTTVHSDETLRIHQSTLEPDLVVVTENKEDTGGQSRGGRRPESREGNAREWPSQSTALGPHGNF